jgi:hypothetical protein
VCPRRIRSQVCESWRHHAWTEEETGRTKRVTSNVNTSAKQCGSYTSLTLLYLFPLVVYPSSRCARYPKHHRLSACCLDCERRSIALLVADLLSRSFHSWLARLRGLNCDHSGSGHPGTIDYAHSRAYCLRHWADGDWRWFGERVMAVGQALVRERCIVCRRRSGSYLPDHRDGL